MRHRGRVQKKAIVTTSWDDGHPLDLRLAERLAACGIRGTFYITPRHSDLPVLSPSNIRALRSVGMEVGSHTMTHPVLTGLGRSRIRSELVDSKVFLEDVLGEEVAAFCYPKGRYSRDVCAAVAEAGYRIARTTVAFRTTPGGSPYLMAVTLQLYPHTRATHFRHAVRKLNVGGLVGWWRAARCAADLTELCARFYEKVRVEGGVFHLWGHSWEIEKLGLWHLLEDLLRRIAGDPGVLYLTNSEAWEVAAP